MRPEGEALHAPLGQAPQGQTAPGQTPGRLAQYGVCFILISISGMILYNLGNPEKLVRPHKHLRAREKTGFPRNFEHVGNNDEVMNKGRIGLYTNSPPLVDINEGVVPESRPKKTLSTLNEYVSGAHSNHMVLVGRPKVVAPLNKTSLTFHKTQQFDHHKHSDIAVTSERRGNHTKRFQSAGNRTSLVNVTSADHETRLSLLDMH